MPSGLAACHGVLYLQFPIPIERLHCCRGGLRFGSLAAVYYGVQGLTGVARAKEDLRNTIAAGLTSGCLFGAIYCAPSSMMALPKAHACLCTPAALSSPCSLAAVLR